MIKYTKEELYEIRDEGKIDGDIINLAIKGLAAGGLVKALELLRKKSLPSIRNLDRRKYEIANSALIQFSEECS